MKIWLVGESNPYGADPAFALYPMPRESAGGRLCQLILGMQRFAYLSAFARVNLLAQPKWSAPKARAAAQDIKNAVKAGDKAILLGRKVFDAFAPFGNGDLPWSPFTPWRPFYVVAESYLTLPHPSGLNRIWNEPGAIEKCRAAVKAFAPEIADVIGVAGG